MLETAPLFSQGNSLWRAWTCEENLIIVYVYTTLWWELSIRGLITLVQFLFRTRACSPEPLIRPNSHLYTLYYTPTKGEVDRMNGWHGRWDTHTRHLLVRFEGCWKTKSEDFVCCQSSPVSNTFVKQAPQKWSQWKTPGSRSSHRKEFRVDGWVGKHRTSAQASCPHSSFKIYDK